MKDGRDVTVHNCHSQAVWKQPCVVVVNSSQYPTPLGRWVGMWLRFPFPGCRAWAVKREEDGSLLAHRAPGAGGVPPDCPPPPITHVLIVRPRGLLSVLWARPWPALAWTAKAPVPSPSTTPWAALAQPLVLPNGVEEEGWQKPPLEMQS